MILKCSSSRRLWFGLLFAFSFRLSYSIISPLILVFCLLYLVLCYVRSLHDAVYTVKTLHPTNGYIFSVIFACLWSCLLIFQGISLVVLTLFELFLAPLLILLMGVSLTLFVLIQEFCFVFVFMFYVLFKKENSVQFPNSDRFLICQRLPTLWCRTMHMCNLLWFRLAIVSSRSLMVIFSLRSPKRNGASWMRTSLKMVQTIWSILTTW